MLWPIALTLLGIWCSVPQCQSFCSLIYKIFLLLPDSLGGLIQKQRHYFANKGPSSQGYGFSSGHVRIWELDSEESWVWKNWCFWTVVLEKTLESPLDSKKIQPVNPKGNQPWISLEGLMLKLRAGGEGGSRGWDGWMAPPTQWAWIRANSQRQWRSEEPDMLLSMELKRVAHNLVTKQQ